MSITSLSLAFWKVSSSLKTNQYLSKELLIMLVVVDDHFYIALFSALEQTHCLVSNST